MTSKHPPRAQPDKMLSLPWLLIGRGRAGRRGCTAESEACSPPPCTRQATVAAAVVVIVAVTFFWLLQLVLLIRDCGCCRGWSTECRSNHRSLTGRRGNRRWFTGRRDAIHRKARSANVGARYNRNNKKNATEYIRVCLI